MRWWSVALHATATRFWTMVAIRIGLPSFGRDATVWSVFGMGYLFVPLVLPILGLLYLRTHGPRRAAGEGDPS